MLAVLAAFEPVRHNELVWDDEQNLVLNEHWRGLNAEHVRWMFTTFHGGHYQPLTWLSFAVEYALWGGLNPTGIHLANVAIHALNALLVYVVGRQVLNMTVLAANRGVDAGAFFAALLFAVHPLRVESVAWATERRDVLSTMWLLIATSLYLRHVARETRSSGNAARRSPQGTELLGPALLFYVFSLLSKASGMTFPVVLLVLDGFPLCRRIRIRVIVEKLAFLVPAGLAAAAALAAQRASGALQDLAWDASGIGMAIAMRAMRAAYGITFYIAKSIWPSGLSPLYELDPKASPFDAKFMLSTVVILAAIAGLWIFRRRVRGLFAALVIYAVILAPVLGFVQSGPQLVADRYSYLSCIPLALLAGWLIARVAQVSQNSGNRRMAFGVCAVATLAMIFQTRAQNRIWRDPYTLWSTAVERRPNTGMAQANLALVLNQRGEFEAARMHAQRALQILPGNLAAHTALGTASLAMGDFTTAKEHLLTAMEIRERLKKPDASTLAALGVTLAQLGDSKRAEELLETARKLEPANPSWSIDLAVLYVHQKRSDDARRVLMDFLAIDPGRPEVWRRLGSIEKEAGRVASAIETWKTGLAYTPQDVDLRALMAWTLATTQYDAIRDPNRALALAEAAVRDSGGRCLRAVEAQAAAYADLGRFDQANDLLSRLLEENRAAISNSIRERIVKEIDSYKKESPTRE